MRTFEPDAALPYAYPLPVGSRQSVIMRLPSLRPRTHTLLLFALVLVACGEGSGPLPPPSGPRPLSAGTFHMQSANALALPAKIAERYIGITLAETILDESTLVIDVAGDSWTQTYTTHVLHNGLLDRTEVVYDEGTWAQTGNDFTFTSTLRVRAFTVTATSSTAVRTVEPMVSFAGATDVVGVYTVTTP